MQFCSVVVKVYLDSDATGDYEVHLWGFFFSLCQKSLCELFFLSRITFPEKQKHMKAWKIIIVSRSILKLIHKYENNSAELTRCIGYK